MLVPSYGASGPPSGAAGGDLTGTYPNPTVGAAKITAAKMSSGAAASGTVATADGGGGVSYAAGAAGGGGNGCFLTKTTNQTLANDTPAALTWDTEIYDTDGYHAANSADIIIPAGKAGKYLITTTVRFHANATGYRAVLVENITSGVFVYDGLDDIAQASGPTYRKTTCVLQCAVGDHINILASQQSGGNLDVEPSGSGNGSVFVEVALL